MIADAVYHYENFFTFISDPAHNNITATVTFDDTVTPAYSGTIGYAVGGHVLSIEISAGTVTIPFNDIRNPYDNFFTFQNGQLVEWFIDAQQLSFDLAANTRFDITTGNPGRGGYYDSISNLFVFGGNPSFNDQAPGTWTREEPVATSVATQVPMPDFALAALAVFLAGAGMRRNARYKQGAKSALTP